MISYVRIQNKMRQFTKIKSCEWPRENKVSRITGYSTCTRILKVTCYKLLLIFFFYKEDLLSKMSLFCIFT